MLLFNIQISCPSMGEKQKVDFKTLAYTMNDQLDNKIKYSIKRYSKNCTQNNKSRRKLTDLVCTTSFRNLTNM